MISYTFFSPRQIVFGWGKRTELPALASKIGSRVFVIVGSRTLVASGVIEEIIRALRQGGLETVTFTAPSREPEVRDVDDLMRFIREQKPTPRDLVLAIGGGATIDLAKAAAAIATNLHGNTVFDFLEGVGTGLQLTASPLPLIAVPTTAGTGAEATKNAVISSNSLETLNSSEGRTNEPVATDSTPDPLPFKKSLRSDDMIPRIALVDPELCISVPSQITSASGMDAITQLIESYISRRAAPIPQALCIHGLQLAIPSLPIAVKEGTNRPAREAMSHAALLSGLALANSGLGLAHGVAAALGVTCGIAHGLACAVMLPAALHYNLPVRTKEFAELERIFDADAGNDTVAANAFVDRIETICDVLTIPRRLRDIGVKLEQIPDLVKGSRGNSMSGNPREISDARLEQMLTNMF